MQFVAEYLFCNLYFCTESQSFLFKKKKLRRLGAAHLSAYTEQTIHNRNKKTLEPYLSADQAKTLYRQRGYAG